jgi:CO/xanthine dehydrogenase Mo-binding subunit
MGAASLAAAQPRRDTSTGRGIVDEVEIDRRSVKVWACKFTIAHDCRLITNPGGLRRCIEGNVVQGTSRALSEEVTFDRPRLTSIDWTGYSRSSTSARHPNDLQSGRIDDHTAGQSYLR